MKSYRLLFFAVIAMAVVWVVKVNAGTLQMTTYYPAPTGYYNNLSVKGGFLQIPCYKSDPSAAPDNAIWIIDVSGPNCTAPPN